MMAARLQSVLVELGMTLKPDIDAWDGRQQGRSAAVPGYPELQMTMRDRMEILGVLMAVEDMETVEHRLSKADKAFWANASVFQCLDILLARRYQEYCKRVRSIALYGASLWRWCPELRDKLLAWENEKLRRICLVRRRTNESSEHWFSRWTAMARGTFQKAGFSSCPTEMLKLQWRLVDLGMRNLRAGLGDTSPTAACSGCGDGGFGCYGDGGVGSGGGSCGEGNGSSGGGGNGSSDVGGAGSSGDGGDGGRGDGPAYKRRRRDLTKQVNRLLGACIVRLATWWWRRRQVVGLCIDPSNRQKWRRIIRGRPKQDWEHVFARIWGDEWVDLAGTDDWAAHLPEFLTRAWALYGKRSPEEEWGQSWGMEKQGFSQGRKDVRTDTKPEADWQIDSQLRGEIVGDSLTTVQWINGEWAAHGPQKQRQVYLLRRRAAQVFAGPARPPADWAMPARHAFREQNCKADKLADWGREGRTWREVDKKVWCCFRDRVTRGQGGHFRVWFDGSCIGRSAGLGWWAEVRDQWSGPVETWQPVAAACRPGSGDSLQAEADAALDALGLAAFLSGGRDCEWEGAALRGRKGTQDHFG